MRIRSDKRWGNREDSGTPSEYAMICLRMLAIPAAFPLCRVADKGEKSIYKTDK
jgi:hypothetical protein